MTGELPKRRSASSLTVRQCQTRKDENKPPTFLFLSIHLSKSAKPTPSQAQLPTEDAPTARLPGPSSPPSAINPLPGQRPKPPSFAPPQRSAASRAGEPSCQPLRTDAEASGSADTPEHEGQRSPDPVARISSAPPQLPKTPEAPHHQVVDRGAPSVRQLLRTAPTNVNNPA